MIPVRIILRGFFFMNIPDLYTEYLISTGVCIDTRILKAGQIFFALSGSKVDGSTYARKAIDQGARLAIVENASLEDQDTKIIYVPSVTAVLQDLARWHRSQIHIPVIAITGSVAKTTTKELIHAVLSTQYNVTATLGNLNNHLGVPLSILSISSSTEIAVIEMGANHIGEIKLLCDIAQPTHGLITKIGKAHLEGFGSLEGIIIAKSDLYRHIQESKGVAFINEEDPLLLDVSRGFDMQKVYYQDQIKSSLIQAEPYLQLQMKTTGASIDVKTQLPGQYNQINFLAAAAIGTYFNIALSNIQKALQSYQSAMNRSQLISVDTNLFIMDAYNANPLSMSAAIESFAASTEINQKVLILGEMKELGLSKIQEHQDIVALIQRYEWYKVCLVGSAFLESGEHEQFLYFQDVLDLKKWFDLQSFTRTTFLVKGSRSMELERLVPELSHDLKH